MLIIGHRCCGGQYPENTLAAIDAAAPHVDLIELDVMRCGSGELVVFHDETLDRLTEHTGRVDQTDWETLCELTVGESNERIPRFREAVERLPEGTGLNLDLVDGSCVADAVEVVSELDEPIVLSTKDERALEYCREELPRESSLLTGYSFIDDLEHNLERALELDCEYVHIPYPVCLETSLVSRAHEVGLMVDAWTISTSEPVEALREVGVDAMTVDRWDILPAKLS